METFVASFLLAVAEVPSSVILFFFTKTIPAYILTEKKGISGEKPGGIGKKIGRPI